MVLVRDMIATFMILLPALVIFLGLFGFILKVIFKKRGRGCEGQPSDPIKIILYVTLNLFLFLALLVSLMIYTSTFKGLPWYEPCGMQFLVILIFLTPAFLAIGVTLLILGRYYHIPRFSKLLPFIAAAGLSLPILGPLNRGILIGLPINIILCLAVLAVMVTSIKSLLKSVPNV